MLYAQTLVAICNKLEHLPLLFTSTLVYYLWASLEPTSVEPLAGHHSKARPLALPENIIPGFEWIGVANSLAYYNASTIKTVKGF